MIGSSHSLPNGLRMDAFLFFFFFCDCNCRDINKERVKTRKRWCTIFVILTRPKKKSRQTPNVYAVCLFILLFPQYWTNSFSHWSRNNKLQAKYCLTHIFALFSCPKGNYIASTLLLPFMWRLSRPHKMLRDCEAAEPKIIMPTNGWSK